MRGKTWLNGLTRTTIKYKINSLLGLKLSAPKLITEPKTFYMHIGSIISAGLMITAKFGKIVSINH
jgi:hypothetical protein